MDERKGHRNRHIFRGLGRSDHLRSRISVVAREDFQDRGYRWLVVRLTEGPRGGRKTIAVNGRAVGEFVRTGPPAKEKKEWWVTRSYPIPAGLLKNGPIEIRFTEPGIAVSAVALSAERLPDTK